MTRNSIPMLCCAAMVLVTSIVLADSPQQPASADKADDIQAAAEHIRRAAAHLDAAGQKELSQKWRHEAQQLQKHALLANKLRELGKLRREVQVLQNELGKRNSVILHTKVIEVDTSKLPKGDEDLKRFLQSIQTTDSRECNVEVVSDTKNFEALVARLVVRKCARILAEPSIVTLSGRPASFQSGGEIPIVVPNSDSAASVEYRPIGLKLDFVPIVRGDGKIQVELRADISHIDEARSVTINGARIPGLKRRFVDLAATMAPGQTLMVSGLLSKDRDDNETALIVVVRGELVEAMVPRTQPALTPRVPQTATYPTPAKTEVKRGRSVAEEIQTWFAPRTQAPPLPRRAETSPPVPSTKARY